MVKKMHNNNDAYGRVASYYDVFCEPLLGRARDHMARLCHEQGAKRVLDICCGTGKQIQRYQTLGIESYGVDMSCGMLQVASNITPTIVCADATHLPFATATFDVATVSLALHEMPLASAEALVHEALRVAKTLMIMDYCMAERNIEVPAASLAFLVERMVGGEHYQNYRIFMRQGAVEGLVTRLALRRLARHKIWAGAGVIDLVQAC